MSAPNIRPKPQGLDKPLATRIIKVMSRVNTRVYRATGGRVGRNWRIRDHDRVAFHCSRNHAGSQKGAHAPIVTLRT